MNRREFLALSGMLGAGLVLNPVAIVRAADEDLEALAKKYIPFMTKPVSVTLDPRETHVREVTPGNYDRLVYGNDGGSLVMFVRKPDNTVPSADEGLASVFRALHDKYHNKVDFFVYYDNKYPTAPGVNVGSQKYLDEGIRATPSIAMYSPFDLLKGETPQKNNGRIKRIDILEGGFRNENSWKIYYEGLCEWLETNITNPNGKWVVGFKIAGSPKGPLKKVYLK